MQEEIKKLEEKLYLLKHSKKCKCCGKEFISKKSNTEYCCHNCCANSWKKRRSPERIKKDNEKAKLYMRQRRVKRKK